METKDIVRPIKGCKAFAKFLGVSEKTVYNWKNSGIIKYTEIGGLFFFDPTDYKKEKSKQSPRKRK